MSVEACRRGIRWGTRHVHEAEGASARRWERFGWETGPKKKKFPVHFCSVRFPCAIGAVRGVAHEFAYMSGSGCNRVVEMRRASELRRMGVSFPAGGGTHEARSKWPLPKSEIFFRVLRVVHLKRDRQDVDGGEAGSC